MESATNALATGEGYDSTALSCAGIDGLTKTLWYEVVGDGSCLSASVASETFEAVLGLYEGACGELSCLDQTVYGLGSSRDLLFWRSEIGTSYKIVVGGAYGPYSGDFILAITVRSLLSVVCSLSACLDCELRVTPTHLKAHFCPHKGGGRLSGASRERRMRNCLQCYRLSVHFHRQHSFCLPFEHWWIQ